MRSLILFFLNNCNYPPHLSPVALTRTRAHSRAPQCVSFSDDERFLCTIGDATDKKMLVWDMHTGNLVCSQLATPARTKVCFRSGGGDQRCGHLYLIRAVN